MVARGVEAEPPRERWDPEGEMKDPQADANESRSP